MPARSASPGTLLEASLSSELLPDFHTVKRRRRKNSSTNCYQWKKEILRSGLPCEGKGGGGQLYGGCRQGAPLPVIRGPLLPPFGWSLGE
ncbi:hypothetical protein cyc_01818 [Cyclospora cayetanensis]|uniref:Uncharacterized protein n=1 Tax=Cyclospora cayetanensis TaxID=88456 RepID=A0A1D3CSM1_9EIME|nr:hypothetical protein cyc_01818 [Cyclospora cayetanensis]